VTLYARIDTAQIDSTNIYRGTLGGLTWVDDNDVEVDVATPPATGSWINVQGVSGRRGVGYVLLVDPDPDTLNVAVTWEDHYIPDPAPAVVTPEPVVDDTDPPPADQPGVTVTETTVSRTAPIGQASGDHPG
jgi:hypothetical protein